MRPNSPLRRRLTDTSYTLVYELLSQTDSLPNGAAISSAGAIVQIPEIFHVKRTSINHTSSPLTRGASFSLPHPVYRRFKRSVTL